MQKGKDLSASSGEKMGRRKFRKRARKNKLWMGFRVLPAGSLSKKKKGAKGWEGAFCREDRTVRGKRSKGSAMHLQKGCERGMNAKNKVIHFIGNDAHARIALPGGKKTLERDLR